MTERTDSPAAAPVAQHPLASFHRDRGATLETVGGAERVARHDGIQDELDRLTGGAAWVDRAHQGRLELVGPDRLRLLNGLTTCPVEELTPGTGTYGFITSAQGRVLADALILELEDRTWLELPPTRGREVGDHIRKYIIADQVEVLPLGDMLPISVVGPDAEACLGIALPAGDRVHAKVEVAGIEVHAVRHGIAGLPACTLWVSASVAKPLVEGLGDELGLRPAGNQALDVLRVRELIPAFGAEFGPDHFPQETGAEEAAVSYEKGCYLGQEVVARIHYRGKVNRDLRRLVFDGAPAVGAALLHDGREVGVIGTVEAWAAEGAPRRGLAIVHSRGGEIGTILEVAEGGQATVEAEPAGRVS